MKIAIIGSGYVGLTVGTCFAELGNNVTCVDNDKGKIEMLNKGKVPIYEPGLDKLIKKNVKRKKLSFSTALKDSVKKADVVFIAVGTPPKPNGEADLSYVENVANEIAKSIDHYTVIVEKSTVPVETGEKVAETLRISNVSEKLFDVVSNPEFLREGTAILDFMEPDRIVIGTNSKKAAKVMEKLYKPLKAPIIFTDIRSAEIIKHASNSFLATKISFINAVARFCDLAKADVKKVAEGMGYDKRIGRSFLDAGLGYGGSCFPKDVSAFVQIADKYGYDFKLLKDVQDINKEQRDYFVKKIADSVWNIKGKTIAVFGLAFKPNTDDLRDAPSIDVIHALQKEGALIKAYDPVAEEKAKQLFHGLQYCSSPYDAAKGSDAIVICTEWPEFKKLNLKKLKSIMNSPLVIDGRNIFEKAQMEKSGFRYVSVGR